MPAVMVELADAVVAAIDGATLSQAFRARRLYVPARKLENFAKGVVEASVVPRDVATAWLSRRDDDFSYVVDVGLQVRVGEGAMGEEELVGAIDPYLLLAEEVLDLFRGKDLAVAGEAMLCATAACSVLYLPQHLDEHRVFTSVVTLTFKRVRART